MYRCAKCKKEVIIIPNEKPIKKCKCKASILADMSSIAQGVGGIRR